MAEIVATGSNFTEGTPASLDYNEGENEPVAFKDTGEYVDIAMGLLTSHEVGCKRSPRLR